MYRPVCKLKLALYGHPKAGFYWQEHCKTALRKCGWEQVPSWESMFMHRGKQLFLSVYVDDFKMAGLAKNIPQAWNELGKYLELEPATEFHGGTYLGQTQYNVEVDQYLVQAQTKRWNDLFQDIRTGTYDSSLGNFTAKDQKHKSENPKMEVDIEAASGILNPTLDDVGSVVFEPNKGKHGSKSQRQK